MSADRFVVTALVDDAPAFEERFEQAPRHVAPDFDLMKAPTERRIEFYVANADPAVARQQFEDALTFVGQTASGVEIHPA